MNKADEYKSTFMAQKHVSHQHKMCVKPSCAAFISQIINELCRAVAKSLFLRLPCCFMVATGFLCQLQFGHSLSSSYFKIMIFPGTYWFGYRRWRKRGEMVLSVCKKLYFSARYDVRLSDKTHFFLPPEHRWKLSLCFQSSPSAHGPQNPLKQWPFSSADLTKLHPTRNVGWKNCIILHLCSALFS